LSAHLWELMRGGLVVQALRVAAELGIADELAEGPRPLRELAEHAGVDADALHRLLRALASEGVFAETEPGVFGNTEESELLRRDADWNAFAHFFGGVWSAALLEAPHAVRTGEDTFARVFGVGWWDWLTARPEETALFDRAMQGGAGRRVEALAELPWDGETVVDVGGGNGTLLIELLRRHESLRGIVFDLPEVAAEAEERVAAAGLADRIDVVGGSMFDGVPPGGVYVLAVVLHDWDDDHAAKILAQVRAAAPAHARVLIADAVIPPGNDPHGAKWLDLLMLVLNRGRERTEDEWRALLERSGFRVERIEDGLIDARPA
jgi:O-methyltransferase/methyltransferase family protein